MTPLPSEYTPTGDDKGGKFSPADIFFKYLAHLPLFLVILALSVAAGLLYLRYTTPKYTSSVQMLVKSGETNPVYGKQGDIVERALYGPRDINMANEIQKLRNVAVVSRAVAKHDLHIQYFNVGNIKTSNLFNKVPYILEPVEIRDSNAVYRIRFARISKNGYSLMRGEEPGDAHLWGDLLNINGSSFRLIHRPGAFMVESDGVNIATWVNPVTRAAEILRDLAIYVADPRTTILTFSLTSENPEMGAFTLDRLVEEYIVYSKESKNVAAESTINFIEDRLDSLSGELLALERDKNIFLDRNDFLPISQQSSVFSNRLMAAEEEIHKLDWQMRMMDFTKDYINSPAKKTEIVPSALGIEDPTIGALIGEYNSLRLEKKKQEEQQRPGSLPIVQLDKQMEEIERSLDERFGNYRRVLQTQRSDLQNRSREYLGYLARIPEKERRQLELERQQKVKEELYMYLLQRKEEIAITTTSTDPAYESMNPANPGLQPIEPDAKKIRMFSILLGLLLPIGVIYLRDLLNDRVTIRDDIAKGTDANIVGEIGHVENNQSLVVAGNSRNIIAEQFRIVRSNLGFLMDQKGFQTILVTSTVSGEGKSFIAVNLAAVLSLADKKVALLEFDLRRPRIMKNLGLKRTDTGISNVLLGLSDPANVYTPLPGYPDLHVYPSGIVPPNPAELVLSETAKNFFDYLKANYDYIIIDSAPVGLVSDTFSLAPYVDCSLFVVRHRFTYKRQLSFIDEIYKSGKLPYLWLVVNDLKMGNRYGYYGYGYGYGKGYGYGYGHYYGYGGGYFSKGADAYYDVKVPEWKRKLRSWRLFR